MVSSVTDWGANCYGISKSKILTANLSFYVIYKRIPRWRSHRSLAGLSPIQRSDCRGRGRNCLPAVGHKPRHQQWFSRATLRRQLWHRPWALRNANPQALPPSGNAGSREAPRHSPGDSTCRWTSALRPKFLRRLFLYVHLATNRFMYCLWPLSCSQHSPELLQPGPRGLPWDETTEAYDLPICKEACWLRFSLKDRCWHEQGLPPNRWKENSENMTATYIIRCVSDEKSTYLPKINLRS